MKLKIKTISNELIQRARQADLASVLMLRFNYDLKSEGNRQYRDRKHDSLVIKDNMYFWNSKSIGGNSVDFLMKHHNLSFKEAIEILTNENFTQQKGSEELNSQQSFTLPTKAKSFQRAFAYLNQTRNIDNSIITDLIDNKQLIQTKKRNNIAFIVYDEDNQMAGAELQGTLDKLRFKGIARNSNTQYGFNIRTSCNVKKCFAFESAIDLISFYELYKHTEAIKDSILLSLAGLKVNTLRHMLKAFKIDSEASCNVFICTDNDKASDNFKINLEKTEINFKEVIVPKNLKDWNDYLKYKKQ